MFWVICIFLVWGLNMTMFTSMVCITPFVKIYRFIGNFLVTILTFLNIHNPLQNDRNSLSKYSYFILILLFKFKSMNKSNLVAIFTAIGAIICCIWLRILARCNIALILLLIVTNLISANTFCY